MVVELAGEGIKTGVGVWRKGIYLADIGVWHRIEFGQVLDPRQMVPGAPLISHGEDPVRWQGLLQLERIEVSVRNRHVRRVRIDIGCALIWKNRRQTVGGVQRSDQSRIRRVTQWVVAGTQ